MKEKVWLLFILIAIVSCSKYEPKEEFSLDSLVFMEENHKSIKLINGVDFDYKDTTSNGIFLKMRSEKRKLQLMELVNPEIVMRTDTGAVDCAPLNIFSSVLPDSPFYFNVDMQGRIMVWTDKKLLFLERTEIIL